MKKGKDWKGRQKIVCLAMSRFAEPETQTLVKTLYKDFSPATLFIQFNINLEECLMINMYGTGSYWMQECFIAVRTLNMEIDRMEGIGI